MKQIFICIVISFGVGQISFAQFLNYSGYPNIENYSPDKYNGHIQNWGFAEDSNGVIYVSNLASVIRYDGVNWEKIPLPNARTYSLKATGEGRIFVGGNDEFGYLDVPKSDSLTTPQYYSLRHLIPDSIDLNRVFNIESSENEVVFQSNDYLVYFDGDSAKVFRAKVRYSHLFKKGDTIFVREVLSGIKQVEQDTLILISGENFFSEESLFAHLPLSNKELYCSYSACYRKQNEAYVPFETEVDDYLAANFLDEAIVLKNGTIFIATRTGGVVHLDENGKLIRIIDEETGLINNTVYGLYEDRYGSVWVATVNGISRIDVSVPLRFFDERYGIDETVNDVLLYQRNLIFSSAEGVYQWRAGKPFPEKYRVRANCSQLCVVNGELYVVCGGELFKKNEFNFSRVEPLVTVFRLTKYAPPDLMIFGHENGFYLANLVGDRTEILYEIGDLQINPTSMNVDENQTIWIGNSNKGLVQVKLVWENGKVTNHHINQFLAELQNSSDDNRVHVTTLDNKPSFLTWGKGIQRYNPETGELELETRYGELFSDTTRQYFWASEDNEGNVWFRSDSEYQAALLQEDGSYKTYEGVLSLIDHRQSNDIFPDENGYVWYATDQGLVRFNKNHNFDHSKPFYTQINKVLVRNDSLINGGNQDQEPVLDYKDNELRFTFAGASYFAPEETQYRVQLRGFEDNWTTWNNENQKDYTNIPEGNYSFMVQAKNVFGVVSESTPFSFLVLPPWYRTWWAYLLYSFTIAGLMYTAYKIRVNQILRVQRIRNRIASDLHDEVSATLSSISYFAQAIQSDELKGDKTRFINLIAKSAGDAKEKITDIVWAINPENDDWQNFLAKCRRYASDLLESKGIEYSLKIDEHIPGKLDMQLRQHLWLIFKEMLTNAVRHSLAKQLDIIMKYEEGKLKLVVQDNGTGMDVDKVKKGNGLVNIQKRAVLINADISLKTEEGFGTRWVLKVPL